MTAPNPILLKLFQKVSKRFELFQSYLSRECPLCHVSCQVRNLGRHYRTGCCGWAKRILKILRRKLDRYNISFKGVNQQLLWAYKASRVKRKVYSELQYDPIGILPMDMSAPMFKCKMNGGIVFVIPNPSGDDHVLSSCQVGTREPLEQNRGLSKMHRRSRWVPHTP